MTRRRRKITPFAYTQRSQVARRLRAAAGSGPGVIVISPQPVQGRYIRVTYRHRLGFQLLFLNLKLELVSDNVKWP